MKELLVVLLLAHVHAASASSSTNERLVYSTTIDGDATSYHLGGRNVITGAEATILDPGARYSVRLTAFNELGASETSDAVQVGPLHDLAPDAPTLVDVLSVSDDSTLRVDFDTPSLDGGSAIDRYSVQYDTSPAFDDDPQTVTKSVVREKQMVLVESPNVQHEVQAIRATVEVVNEVQSVRSTVVGVDEIQVVTTTADDVVAEVQTVTTTAVDTDEEQIIAILADDVDEIQLVRTYGDDVPEIQEVTASVERVNEVQRLGIVISNINTDGDNVNSAACYGVNVGEPCQDVEEALSGSFTVSFDFDECGSSNGGGGSNFCQEAVLQYVPSAGVISCTPGLVSNPTMGGDHCVSTPVTPGGAASFLASEGDAGTLQHAINEMIDDNGTPFMTFGSETGMPGKPTGVTVTRTGRIKTKGSCTLDSSGGGSSSPAPATCSGEYEILYEIEFDAHHSSGDVPPLTIVNSGVRIDTTSTSYTTTMCPSAYYTEGCVTPTGSAADLNHGNFYENSASDTAVESVKGSQPNGLVELDYECESSVTRLGGGFTMSTSVSGTEAAFDDGSFTDGMLEGQYIRFSSGNGIDLYRKIISIDDVADQITLETSAPPSTDYTDVEYGTYHSDWDESDGNGTGVSSHCLASRVQTTLAIDVGTKVASISQTDWEGKIGGLSVIDSTGIAVSRRLVPDLSANIGFIWSITFEKQPGSVHEMSCSTVSGDVTCSVATVQESSMIGGSFALSTTWPHEYEKEVPGTYTSSSLSANIDANTLKQELEAITDGNIRVFGTLNVSREPFVPSSQLRWSGGYTWTITFASRGGNIPSLDTDGGANLVGSNVQLEVSDEDSGDADLYQGARDSALFSTDDPGTARDGNQVAGSFALSWDGNLLHPAVSPSASIFAIQTGGSNANRFMALSATDMKSLLTQHVFGGRPGQIHVVRSSTPTQWMSYAYTVIFRHQDVGGDVASLTYVPTASSLIGQGAVAIVTESVRGTSIRGTFQLRFNGETTRPLNHDASAEDMEVALNQLTSIAPSAVIVSRTPEPIRTGPADGSGGSSTQVGGYVWTVTFASNVWKDPTEPHDLSDVPGNWFGPSIAASASHDDVWKSLGFPKAWGKNVGDVPLMECVDSGLSTTNGGVPSNGCVVAELVRGTDPIGGGFKLCLDSAGTNSNGVMSVETTACTDMIAHNAPASAFDSGGDGSSMEEKLEQLDNIGDVAVTRSAVNPRNGGYSWTIEYLRDADGPCQQKDDVTGLCNAPGNVPKLCSTTSGTTSADSFCDAGGLSGSCERPGKCSKLVVMDATDYANSVRPMGSAERQLIRVMDSNYLGWAGGSVVAASDIAEYKLLVNGIETDCIRHNAEADDVATKIQAVLDVVTSISISEQGVVKVERIRSEVDAPNGFLYYVSIYDAGDLPPITASFAPGTCGGVGGANDFGIGQQVIVEGISDGTIHSTTCSDCVDGVVQRGNFTAFDDGGDGVGGGTAATLPWDTSPEEVASHILTTSGRTVDVTRTVLDKYGVIEWELTFVGNPSETPPGAGDVPLLHVVQAADTGGTTNTPIVNEIQKGSSGLGGSFLVDYFSSSGPRQVECDESASRLAAKLSEMSTVGKVHVTRDCFPDCLSGGWGDVAVDGTSATPTRGGLEWKLYFLENPGIYNGFTFPPGSGSIDSPSIDAGALEGSSALVESASVVEGSLPLTGTFHLEIDGEQTAPIPYASDSTTLEQSLFDLSNTGRISVQTRDAATKAIPNVLVSVDQDASILQLQAGSDDLRNHLAPGDRFRVGFGDGGSEPDGAIEIGSARLTTNSPVLNLSSSSATSTTSSTSSRSQLNLHVGEHVRVQGDVYNIVRNSVEVQSLAVARADGQADDYFYHLQVGIGDVTETSSSCLKFDASALNVQQVLEELSFFQDGDVVVSRSDSTTGTLGDAHLYRIYFVGESLLALGDLPEIMVIDCSLGLPAGVDSTNSHATVNTIRDGGRVEHQRITLAADAGVTEPVPAYQITIYDDDFSSSVTSPCIEWGTPSLDLISVLNGAFSRAVFTVGAGGIASFDDGNGTPHLYQIQASSFVQGTILMGDMVNVGDSCRGRVVGFVTADGESFHIQAPQGCSAAIGEVIAVEKDTSIIESSSSSSVLSSSSSSSSSHGRGSTEITEITMYSDSAVVASGEGGLFKLRLTHQGLEETTSCIQYGASADTIQMELDGLFDYNLDGVIDEGDEGHIVVTRQGDGSIESGFGFTYWLESRGSPNSGNGVSTVLGNGAPTIEIAAEGLIGDDGGCSDAGGEETMVSSQITVTAGRDSVSSLDYLAGYIQAGSRIKIDASSSSTKTYIIQEVSEDGMMLTLDEPFVGTTVAGTASISIVDGGIPHVDVSVLRPGVDEYIYDIYFTGSGWSDVPDIEISVFGDGTCEADITNVQGGMNRNIAVSTMKNGGAGEIIGTTRDFVLDRAVGPQDEVAETPVHLLPPIYTVHEDTFEVQQVIVKDTDNGAIWGGDAALADASFKLIYVDEATGCLSYQSTESQVEEALGALSGLCSSNSSGSSGSSSDSNSGNNHCVTVTRTVDPVQAPNGFVFTIYFNGEAMAAANRGDVPELTIDTANSDCTPFIPAGGESAEVKTMRNGSASMAYTSSQLPLGPLVGPLESRQISSSVLGPDSSSRWHGSSAQDLVLYRVTGTLWTATFDEYLGDVPAMEISMGSLPQSADARVFDNVLTGVNPTSIALNPLKTGVPHYARVRASSEVGDSLSSSSDMAIPSDVPPPPTNLSVGHALQVEEVQSITLAATHIPEVQRIITSASPMPEVQEVVVAAIPSDSGSSGSGAITGGAFSLRIPEKQTIHISSSSPIAAGAYALTLQYVDPVASTALGGTGTGQIVTQTMTTACIPWSASAGTVQAAIETEASTVNPLGDGAVRVARSGDASYSSNFGYSYEIEFIGSAFRGNIGELAWDTSSCEAFDSPSNDARVQIKTNNDSLAVGTDTARAQLLIESTGGVDIVEGSYKLVVGYIGGIQTTSCIDWDASAHEIEEALETLGNIDSVRVDFEDTIFAAADDSSLEPSTIQRRFNIYFDGHAMHTDGSNAFAGFDPTQSSNLDVIIGASSSCDSFKAFKDNVLTDFESIDDAEATVTIESAYRGGSSTLSAVASDLTIQDVASSLLDAMPMHFPARNILVAQSLEDDERGVTYTLTLGEDNGNVPGLVCNGDNDLLLLETATCTAQTVMDGNALGGYFYIDSSEPIPHDASATQVEAAIEGINGIDDVSVTRSEPDGQEGYSWDVTFLPNPGREFGGDNSGDVDDLAVYSSLQGKDATIQVREITKGNEIGGTFTLSYGDDATTEPIPFDADAETIKDFILESDLGVGQVKISKDNSSKDSEGGMSFRVTFVDNDSDSFGGDRPLLQADSSQLSGAGAVVTVREERKGGTARGDALVISYDMPNHSSGSPITSINIQADQHEEFVGNTSNIQLDADYSVQIVSIRNGNDGVAVLSGSFRLSYDNELTDDIPVNANEKQMKMALEQLNSINTVGVVKNDDDGGGGWIITFHSVVGATVKPLLVGGGSGGTISGSSGSINLYPRDASVEVRLPDCSECLYIAHLLPWKDYNIRARVTNDRGPSDWITATGTAMAVPSAPTNTRLDVVSGDCLELFFSAPLDSGMISSYLIQYDLVQEFPSPLASTSVSCDVPSCQQLICGLDTGTQYYVRVAAVNEVQEQGNRKWSIPLSAIPIDIAPNASEGLYASAWSRNGLQLIIEPPRRYGGSEIETFVISW